MLVTLPVETKRRELYGKLWLSYHLLIRGHEVAIGPAFEINSNLHRIQPDCHIHHNDNDRQVEFIRSVRSAGTLVCLLPTEGAVTTRREYHPEVTEIMDELDYFFTWGDAQKQQLEAKFPESNIITAAGNPRFDVQNADFIRYYQEIGERLRARHGNYVLWNTNYNRANPKYSGIFSKYGVTVHQQEVDIQRALMEAVSDFASRLPEDLTLIVRPHPGEDYTFYENIQRRMPSVCVSDAEDVFSWICGAVCVIHNSSTTGVQAAMADVPVIAYDPPGASEVEIPIANEVSRRCQSLDELVQLVELAKGGQFPNEDASGSILTEEFVNFDHDAGPQIAGLIDALAPADQIDANGFPISVSGILKSRIKASGGMSKVVTAAEGIVPIPRLRAMAYGYQKFPGLTGREIRAILNIISNQDYADVEVSSIPSTNYSFHLSVV